MSSFLAGLLVGAAITAGIAAVAVRLGAVQPAVLTPASSGSVVAASDDRTPRLLRLSHNLNREHPVHLGLERFADLVLDRTGGRITIQIFPNGELGGETVTLEQLQSGTLDFAKASAAPLGSFSPDFSVFSVPYAFRGADHYWAVLNGPVGREILASLDGRGLHGLCYLDAGARSFYTAKSPILGPEDLRGLKIRVMESETAMDMVSAFGAAPTPMAYAELYSALQSGLVDGAENNPPSFYSSRHYEVAAHYTLNEHSRVPDVLIMSAKVWRDLEPSARAIIETAAAEASAYQRDLWTERTAEALDAVRDLGVEVRSTDLEDFAAVVAPLRASYTGSRTGELLERIDAVGRGGG